MALLPKNIAGLDSVGTAKRLLKETIPGRWKLLALSFFCMIGVAGFTGALAYSTQLIVNDVFVANDSSAAYSVALLVVGVTLGKSIFDYSNSIISQLFSRSIISDFQKLLFRDTIGREVRHFAGQHASQKMAQLRLFSEASSRVVVGLSNRLLTDLLTVLALVGVMILQDPIMTLASGIILPLVVVLITILSRRIRDLATAETELTGAFFSIGTEAFEGIKTVKSYQL